MWLVERERVGAVAYGRLQRDGAIRTLIPGVALPLDVPDCPALRRRVLQQTVPLGCQVTGLGVLWAAGHTPLPPALDVRTPVGRHVRNWQAPVPLNFHAVGVLPDPEGPKSPARAATTCLALAIADALRWGPLESAVPAAIAALRSSDDEALSRLAADVRPHVEHDERALSAWDGVWGVLSRAGDASVPRQGHDSFTRPASSKAGDAA